MKKFDRKKIYLTAIACVVAVTAAVAAFGMKAAPEAVPPVPERSAGSVEMVEVVREVEVTRLVETEKEITSQILQDGLNDMGVMITGDYFFTEVVTYSSDLQFLKTSLVIPGSESGFVVSYDGVVEAGLDFGKIAVEKDDQARVITVRIPQAEIHSTVIDYDSFCLHSEKQSWMNPVSAEEYNNALLELETKAQTKAVEKGLLTRANENGRNMIANFVGSLVNPGDYAVKYLTV